jgi:hypothetical protein
MPMYKKRSYGKKRTFKRRAGASWLTRYQPRSTAINRQAPGLGRSLKTKLKTVFFAKLTPDAVTGIWTGYLNPGSCFDPSGGMAALQPAGYDQLKTLYARYLVTGATVKLTFAGAENTTSVFAGQWVASAYPSTVDTAMVTYQGAASQPYSQNVTFSNDSQKTMYFKMNTQKILGSRLPPVAEDCGALIYSNPTAGQNIMLPIFVQSVVASADYVFTVLVEIVQDVIFDQRTQVQDSTET